MDADFEKQVRRAVASAEREAQRLREAADGLEDIAGQLRALFDRAGRPGRRGRRSGPVSPHTTNLDTRA